MKDFAKSIHVGNEKAISSTFHINDYGIEVGQWSWDWRGKAPDKGKQEEIARKIKDYVRQINKDVKGGDSDDRDAVFSQLDKFVRAQGLNKKTGNKKAGNADVVKDGDVWVVLYAEGTKSKEFDSEDEAKKFAAKVGNASVSPVSPVTAPKSDPKKEDDKKKPEKKHNPVDGNGKTFADYIPKKKEGNSSVEEQNEKLFKSLKKDVEEKEEDNDEKIEEVNNRLDWHRKFGNATFDMTDKDYEEEYKRLVQKRNNTKKDTDEYNKIQERLEFIRKKIGRSPFGNVSSDDKFAYVMREFDEGKLKTPDGKVVTSPEQAKAIAYSESKKAENGLARARNAMACNKKVGNSIYSELNKSDKRVVIEEDGSWYVYDKNDKIVEQGHESNADNALGKFKAKGYNKKTIGNKEVTLWSGNDSVLILDDGTVKYLENNSFETDRDKYDSQQKAIEEMTKKGYRKK